MNLLNSPMLALSAQLSPAPQSAQALPRLSAKALQPR